MKIDRARFSNVSYNKCSLKYDPMTVLWRRKVVDIRDDILKGEWWIEEEYSVRFTRGQEIVLSLNLSPTDSSIPLEYLWAYNFKPGQKILSLLLGYGYTGREVRIIDRAIYMKQPTTTSWLKEMLLGEGEVMDRIKIIEP